MKDLLIAQCYFQNMQASVAQHLSETKINEELDFLLESKTEDIRNAFRSDFTKVNIMQASRDSVV